jgi:hypothetical protein
VGLLPCQRINRLGAALVALGYTKRSYAASVRNGVTGHEQEQILEKLYDAGFTNALMQLRGLIGQFIEKPNSQTTKVFELINVMLEVKERIKTYE